MPNKKPKAQFKGKDRYINREISWLHFNDRVIDEAFNSNTPLAERINFLSISSSNLDEFYMVRVAGLKEYVAKGITHKSFDGMTAQEELAEVEESVQDMVERQHDCWVQLRKALEKEDIYCVSGKQLSKKDLAWLEDYFIDNIFPALTPIAIDPSHPFPFLANLSVSLLFKLKDDKNKQQNAIITLPNGMPRFVLLPDMDKVRYITLEDVIILFLDRMMPGVKQIESTLFRIVRDSDLDVEEEDENFLRNFERAVKQRRRGEVIQLKFLKGVSDGLKEFVRDTLDVSEFDIVEVEGLLGLISLTEIYKQLDASLKYPPFEVRFPERLADHKGDCFAAIAAKDFVVHHPFESFDVVVQFLRQATQDPDVISIKQTLYRTSKDSPIIKALIAAAEAGKSVTALVELKARFDEEANIGWARALEAAGAQVVYGFVKLKTHAKVTLVTRKENKKIKSYVHFGTGNYHPNTAKVYTDLSFFTCDSTLCRDAAYLFNYITGYAPPKAFEKLIIAPQEYRNQLMRLIAREVAFAKQGKPATIWAKMNSLVDKDIIDALYEASQAGVIIELVVRGICCLRPGVKGLSDNIRVKSIVGRFLEHSRIAVFGNGTALPSPEALVYMTSADWMPRNLNGRVEVMIPIENPTVHEQIMGQIMVASLKDEQQSWIEQPDGSYKRIKTTTKSLSAHDYFIVNPSLSGRGKALQKAKSTQMLRPKPPKKKK